MHGGSHRIRQIKEGTCCKRRDEMGTTIFYYTGTGNSLWVARRLTGALGITDPVSISGPGSGKETIDEEALGLIFPVYIWGVPSPVIRFIESLNVLHAGYVFAIAVNAGQVSNTLVQLGKILAQKGLSLSSGFQIKMPSNYIPWGGPGPEKKQRKLFALAEEKISRIASLVQERRHMPLEKGPLWQRVLFTAFYKMTFARVPEMDRPFRSDKKCNGCGICGKVCPVANITFLDGKPVWNHHCHQCLSCLQWCPQEAIQYGKKTSRYKRYHHPDIHLKDMLARGRPLNHPII